MFLQKLKLQHNFIMVRDHRAKIQGNLMIQLQENIQTDSRTEGPAEPIS